MKKTILFIILLYLLLFPVFGKTEIKPGFSFDVCTAQDAIIKNGSYNFSLDLRCKVAPSFEIRTPIGFVLANGSYMIDTGLFVAYYPFTNLGLFIGMSLVQFGFVHPSDLLSKNILSLNEILIGYTFNTKPGLFIEPSMSIRDPSGTFTDEYSLIKGAFPCYKTFRLHLNTGWKFSIQKRGGKNNVKI